MAIDKAVDSNQLDGALTATADAIRAKTGDSAAIEWGGSTGFASAISSIPYRVGVNRSDVNFYDYDGTVVASYSAADFANLTALPDNPTHTGLTAQGWNWSLANAKAYVAAYGELNVGQMYITDDGKTRIYIRLNEGRLSPWLGIAVNGTATVDWGDGGAASTVTGNSTADVISTRHTYAQGGDYTVSVSVTGEMAIVGDSTYGSKLLWKNSPTADHNVVYRSAVLRVEIGANCSIGNHALNSLYNLASVTLPNTTSAMGNYAFANGYSLKHVTVPDGVTGLAEGQFYSARGLTSVSIPQSVTKFVQAFNNCPTLASITIPELSNPGNSVFSMCYSLQSITIPSGITTIGNAWFNNCYGLGKIRFTRATPPTVYNSNAFNGIPADCVIYVPRGSLSAYTTAANYPSSSTYTYVEY